MTDGRTNEQIVAQTVNSMWDRGINAAFYATAAGHEIVAALAAAGRIVAPEHEAQVWDEGYLAGVRDLVPNAPAGGPNPYRGKRS